MARSDAVVQTIEIARVVLIRHYDVAIATTLPSLALQACVAYPQKRR